MKKHWTVGLTVIGILCTASFLSGQQIEKDSLRSETAALEMMKAEAELRLAATKLAASDEEKVDLQKHVSEVNTRLTGMAHDPKLSGLFVDYAIRSYATKRPYANSAPRVSQLAAEETFRLTLFQIRQNQKIIELLQEISKKQPGNPK